MPHLLSFHRLICYYCFPSGLNFPLTMISPPSASFSHSNYPTLSLLVQLTQSLSTSPISHPFFPGLTNSIFPAPFVPRSGYSFFSFPRLLFQPSIQSFVSSLSLLPNLYCPPSASFSVFYCNFVVLLLPLHCFFYSHSLAYSLS